MDSKRCGRGDELESAYHSHEDSLRRGYPVIPDQILRDGVHTNHEGASDQGKDAAAVRSINDREGHCLTIANAGRYQYRTVSSLLLVSRD